MLEMGRKMKRNYNKDKIRIEGERIYLRKLTENDASDEYASWINNQEVNKYLETILKKGLKAQIVYSLEYLLKRIVSI